MAAPTTAQLQDLAAHAGFAWKVWSSSAELMNILKEGITNGWDTARVTSAVMNSNWYRTQSAPTREWITLREADPATASIREKARITTIQNTAGALGVNLSSAQLTEIASNSLLLGWTDAQVQRAIGADWTYNPNVAQKGLAAQALDKINTASQDYIVPVSAQAKQQWTSRVLAGTASVDDFTEYAKEQAAGLFPSWAKQIQAGATVRTLADPYAQQAGTILGINPSTIDWTDPKWRQLIDQVDPKTSDHSPMSLADAATTMRTNSAFGYDTSQQALQQGSALTTSLAQKFGAI